MGSLYFSVRQNCADKLKIFVPDKTNQVFRDILRCSERMEGAHSKARAKTATAFSPAIFIKNEHLVVIKGTNHPATYSAGGTQSQARLMHVRELNATNSHQFTFPSCEVSICVSSTPSS